MTAAAAVCFYPAPAGREISAHAQESAPVIRPVSIAIRKCGSRCNRTLGHGLPGTQDDIPWRNFTADCSNLGAEIVEVDQEGFVLPAVSCAGMTRRAAPLTGGNKLRVVESVPLLQVDWQYPQAVNNRAAEAAVQR